VTGIRTVNSITITLSNPVTTNLHTNFGGYVIGPEVYQDIPPNVVNQIYYYCWLHFTDLSAILGNYVLPRLTEEQCFGNTLIITDIPFDGATVYASTAVDGSGCPSGTISSWAAVPSETITWKVTAKWGSSFGLDILAVMEPFTAFFTNGKDPGDASASPPRVWDPEYVRVGGIGLQYVLPRNDILCDGGTMNIGISNSNVGNQTPPCSGYPNTIGLLASYTLDP
jgi:hypothetical protein